MKALLALADGTVFEGTSFGAAGEAVGEVVFNTSMTGYQEILTDPSYCGQIVAMTYPEIGNVGVNPEDVESARPFVEGFIVKEYWPSAEQLARAADARATTCSEHGIPGIQGIDTRALVRQLRDKGALNAVLSTARPRPRAPGRRGPRGARAWMGRTWSARSPAPTPYDWNEGRWTLEGGYANAGRAGHAPRRRLRLRHQAQHPAQPGRAAAAACASCRRRRRPPTCWR